MRETATSPEMAGVNSDSGRGDDGQRNRPFGEVIATLA